MPMRRRIPEAASAAAERYEEMGIAAALSRPWDYPTACGDLAAVLRLAYAQLPKGAQALVFRDALLAFRLLPEVQTGYAVSSANLLLQAVEAALPKQKKALAVSEFKHSVVAHKRRAKAQQETGSLQLPDDVLIHVFSFLGMRSLVAAGLVCWAWNSAASDNRLWQSRKDLVVEKSTNTVVLDPSFSWKKAFHGKYAGHSSQTFRSNRAICRHCGSKIWLTNMTCASRHYCCKIGKNEEKIEPLLPNKVAEYILREKKDLAASSSDSDDSDLDEHRPGRRFWSFEDD